MAKVTQKSGLAGKVGQAGAKAVAAHRDDDTEFDSGGRLPGNIDSAVAQLVRCYFSQYEKGDNKGEYYFRAEGRIVEPKIHEGIPIAGLATSIMEPMCETPGRSRSSIEDHVAWVLNEMRKLGAETKDVEVDDLEQLAADLQEAAPMFRLRTWKGEPTKQYPNPRVNEVWQGAVDFTGDVTEGAVEDNSGEAEPAEPAEEEVDLEALGKAADGKNKAKATEAQAKLSELCEEHGVDPEQYEGWAEVAAVLSEAISGGGEEGAAEGEAEAEGTDEVVPAVGEVWFYKPSKAKKVEVEITAVFTAKKVVNCKNLEDNKTTYKSVPFDQLSDS